MIDNLSLGISHGLILVALWRLLSRPDLDRDDVAPPSSATSRWAGLPTFLKGRRRA